MPNSDKPRPPAPSPNEPPNSRPQAAPNEAELAPRLQALAARLRAAVADDRLTLDAATLGEDGAGIIALLQTHLGVSALSVSGAVRLTEAAPVLKLTADALRDTVAGITATPVSAVFGLAAEELTLQLCLGGGAGWTVGTSLPALAHTWIGTLAFVAEQPNDVRLVLADREGPLDGDTVTLAAGLNLVGELDATRGAAGSFAALLGGPAAALPVSGPLRVRGETSGYDLSGSLPDFSLSPPLLPQLAFHAPRIRALASLRGRDLTSYRAFVRAEAEVVAGGATLPLAISPPDVVRGWRLELQPDSFVPLADLAAFFGAFPGLELFALLPSAVRGMKTFGLQGFTLHLGRETSAFQRLSIRLGMPSGNAGGEVWTIIPGTGATPILALSDLSLQVQVSERGEKKTVSGTLWGMFNLAETLTLQVRLPLPLNEGAWTISAQSGTALPDLRDFARFLGGRALGDLVPKGLADLTGYVLDDLTLIYDPAQTKLTRFDLGLSSAKPWTIIKDRLSIEGLRLRLSVADPMGKASLTGDVAGEIVLGESRIAVSVCRPASDEPWRLNVVGESIELPDLGELAGLAGSSVSALVPEAIRNNGFSLSNLVIQADLSNQAMELFSFMLGTEDAWPLITDVLTVTGAEIFFTFDWTATPGQCATPGSIGGDVRFCQADFLLRATLDGEAWTLSMALAEGARLSLEHLVQAFDATLWTDLSGLGVPNVALSDASATYRTATGSYAFTGTIGVGEAGEAWTLPIGIADIAVERLGGEVSCTCDAEGTVTDKTVFITGAFTIGGIHFEVRHQAGGTLGIDCALVGGDPVPVSALVAGLCRADAGSVTWTKGFKALDEIRIADASARIVLGEAPTFQLSGTISLGDDAEGADKVEVAALFLVTKIDEQWEFALAIRIDASWSLPGFSDAFQAFKLDKSSWMLAASSFTSTEFRLPDEFPAPAMAGIERGLDFYGELSADDTLDTIKSVVTVLPEGTVPATLTVHGHLADPLSDAYLEVLLAGGNEGVPLMGWDAVRVGTLALRLTGTPSFALHGDFILRTIKNPDGSVFHLLLDLAISPSELSITLEKQPGGEAIFAWRDAFGIDALEIALTDLALGIVFEPPALDGTVGGRVGFEYSADPVNTLLRNAPPNPVSVGLMESRRVLLAAVRPERYGDHLHLDYGVAYDRDGVEIEMTVAFLIVAGTPPAPYPYRLAGRFINFTLPYLLKRFAKVDVPDVLMPIQFPDVEFDFRLPNPARPGSAQDLKFMVKGTVVIFGLHCAVDAEFDESRIKFIASADPIVFKVDKTSIVAIVKAKGDASHGPDLLIDSKPEAGQPQIGGDFYCDFFDVVDFGGSVAMLFDAADPAKSKIQFQFQGDVGRLANLSLSLVYQDTDYLAANGSFHLGVSDSLPGFSVDGVRVAEKIDLSKYGGTAGGGVDLTATLALKLDARKPSNPDFSMRVDGAFRLRLSECCSFDIRLGLDLDVDKNTMAELPLKIVKEMAKNVKALFGTLLSSIECFQLLLELGIFVLEEAAKISKVLLVVFGADVEVGASVLHDLGKAAGDAADSLWDVFDSHDSRENTKAMKKGGYSSKETGKSVKDTSDRHGKTYTAANLVRDQALAGFSAPQVAGGLCDAFAEYVINPTAAGQLLADASLTSFPPTAVAGALHAQYPPQTASAAAMAEVLQQVYTARAALGPQDMADALAPLYPVPDVAGALRNHYADATRTAGDMAGYLVPAYQRAGTALSAASLGAALAPLYAAPETASALHAHFGADTDTPAKLGALLLTLYAPTAPLDAPVMASALASTFPAQDIVAELRDSYPDDTGTAAKMAALLTPAYPDLRATDMAAALAAGRYPPRDIAEVLRHGFPGDVDTPDKMAALLRQCGARAPEIAPILKTLYPEACATAKAMAEILRRACGADLDARTLAEALAAASFPAVEVAPLLRSAEVSTANALAALLHDVYANPAIDPATLLSALAAARFNALEDAPAITALYATDAATLGPALVRAMAMTSPLTSLTLSVALAGAGFAAADVAKGVKAGLPDTSVGGMAAALLLAGDARLPSLLRAATASRDAGDDLPTGAKKVVQEVADADGATLITALGSVFTPPNPEAQALLNAAAAAFAAPDAESSAKGILASQPSLDAETLRGMLESAYTSAGKALPCGDVPVAIARAFEFLGKTMTQTEFARIAIEACGDRISPVSLAALLVKVFGDQVTAISLIGVLRTAFPKSDPALDVFTAGAAIAGSLPPAPGEAGALLQTIVETFDLTWLPNDAGSMAMSLWMAGFDRDAARAAMTERLAGAWTPRVSELVDSVYADAAWGTGRESRQAGLTAQQTALAIRTSHADCDAVLMVRVLTDVYQHIRTEDAVDPMAEALRGLTKVYSLNEISAAMAARFSPDWTPANWARFMQIYGA